MSASRRARLAVCRASTSSRVMPGGSATAVSPDRKRARKPAAHSPVEIRTVPLSAGEDAACRRSSVMAASSTLSAAASSSSPAALRRRPSGSRSNRAGPPKAASNEASRRAMVGWLRPRARPAARIEPCRATARNTRTSSQFIALRSPRGGRAAGICRLPASALAASPRTAMTRFSIRETNLPCGPTSAAQKGSLAPRGVPRKRFNDLQNRRSLQLSFGTRLPPINDLARGRPDAAADPGRRSPRAERPTALARRRKRR